MIQDCFHRLEVKVRLIAWEHEQILKNRLQKKKEEQQGMRIYSATNHHNQCALPPNQHASCQVPVYGSIQMMHLPPPPDEHHVVDNTVTPQYSSYTTYYLPTPEQQPQQTVGATNLHQQEEEGMESYHIVPTPSPHHQKRYLSPVRRSLTSSPPSPIRRKLLQNDYDPPRASPPPCAVLREQLRHPTQSAEDMLPCPVLSGAPPPTMERRRRTPSSSIVWSEGTTIIDPPDSYDRFGAAEPDRALSSIQEEQQHYRTTPPSAAKKPPDGK